MKRQSVLAVLMNACGVLSLAIAVYQFVESRVGWSILSLVYAAVFLAGGAVQRSGRHV